jgi:hypothetical protein
MKKIETTIPITPIIVSIIPIPIYDVLIANARPEKKNTNPKKLHIIQPAVL